MPVTPSEHPNGTIIDFGDKVRIERVEGHEDLWTVYELKPVEDGRHPTHGKETTEPAVWLPAASVTKQEATAMATALVTAR